MKKYRIEDFTGGWYIGDFEPSLHKADFEVGYKLHHKGERWPTHYHVKATEINFLFQGRMTIGNEEFVSGDVFVIEPYEIADPVFLEDCHLYVVKTVSDPKDKYIVDK